MIGDVLLAPDSRLVYAQRPRWAQNISDHAPLGLKGSGPDMCRGRFVEESSHGEIGFVVRDVEGLDEDALLLALLDVAGDRHLELVRLAVRREEFANFVHGIFGDIERVAGTHVERLVGFPIIQLSMFLEERKDQLRLWESVDHVGERLRGAHELGPAVACDVHGVVDVDPGVEAFQNRERVDVRRIEECFAVRSPIGKLREIAFVELCGNLARERQAVCVDARALDEQDDVAITNLLGIKQTLLLTDANRGAGKEACSWCDDSLQCRGFSSAPGALGHVAGFTPALDEIIRSRLILEPVR